MKREHVIKDNEKGETMTELTESTWKFNYMISLVEKVCCFRGIRPLTKQIDHIVAMLQLQLLDQHGT